MHKVVNIRAEDNYQLVVTFDDGTVKVYDMGKRLNEWPFELLKNKAFFRSVNVDKGGYGISWDSDIDLSEYELWINGKTIIPLSDKIYK